MMIVPNWHSHSCVNTFTSSEAGQRKAFAALVYLFILTMVGCGNGYSTAMSSANTVTIQGPSMIAIGTQAQFAVTSAESASSRVIWSVTSSSGTAAGSISSDGVFTAPTTASAGSKVSVVATTEEHASGSIAVELTVPTAQAVGKSYYVDALQGEDTNSGLSPLLPWQTIAKVNGASLKPGDRVLFASGRTWKETLVVPASGTTEAPITFGAYGAGAAPVLDTSALATNWTAWQENGFVVYTSVLASQPYVITVDGTALWQGTVPSAALTPIQVPVSQLTPGHFLWDSVSKRVYVRLSSDENPYQHVVKVGQQITAMMIDGKSNVVVQGLQVEGGNWNCIRVVHQSDNIQILNNIIRNCGYAGNQGAVFIDGGRRALIQGNRISYGGNIGVNVSGYGGALSDAATVSGNAIDHMGYDCVTIGPTLDGDVANAMVEHNDVAYCGQVRLDSAGIDAYLPGKGLIVRYNFVHHGGTTMSYSAGIRFDDGSENEVAYGNVVYLNSSGCFQLTGRSNSIYNNTCYHNNELAAYNYGELNSFVSSVSGAPADQKIFNNIVSASVGKKAASINEGATGGQSTYKNLYDTTTAQPSFSWGGKAMTFQQWQASAGMDKESPNPAPANLQSPTNSIFLLNSPSPAIGSGVSMSDYQRDIVGSAVPATPDLGAYQHKGS